MLNLPTPSRRRQWDVTRESKGAWPETVVDGGRLGSHPFEN